MASPVIPDPASLVGEWRLDGPSGETCILHLRSEEAALQAGSLAAPMLGIDGDCAWAPGLSGWRPAPLGLELTDAAGFAIMVFEEGGEGVYRASASGSRLTRR